VRYHVWQISADRAIALTDETHLMRFFFPQELNLMLECSGLSLVRLGKFPAFDEDPDEATWNVIAIARPSTAAETNGPAGDEKSKQTTVFASCPPYASTFPRGGDA
jgi:hypothetical protein